MPIPARLSPHLLSALTCVLVSIGLAIAACGASVTLRGQPPAIMVDTAPPDPCQRVEDVLAWDGVTTASCDSTIDSQ